MLKSSAGPDTYSTGTPSSTITPAGGTPSPTAPAQKGGFLSSLFTNMLGSYSGGNLWATSLGKSLLPVVGQFGQSNPTLGAGVLAAGMGPSDWKTLMSKSEAGSASMGGFSRASLNAFDKKNKTVKAADMLYKLGAEIALDVPGFNVPRPPADLPPARDFFSDGVLSGKVPYKVDWAPEGQAPGALSRQQEAALSKIFKPVPQGDHTDPNVNARNYSANQAIRETDETSAVKVLGENRYSGLYGGATTSRDQYEKALQALSQTNLQVSRPVLLGQDGLPVERPGVTVNPALVAKYQASAGDRYQGFPSYAGMQGWEGNVRQGTTPFLQRWTPLIGENPGSNQTYRPFGSYGDDILGQFTNTVMSGMQPFGAKEDRWKGKYSGLGSDVPYLGSLQGHRYEAGWDVGDQHLTERLPNNTWQQRVPEAIVDSFSIPKNWAHYGMASKLPGHPLHAMRNILGLASKPFVSPLRTATALRNIPTALRNTPAALKNLPSTLKNLPGSVYKNVTTPGGGALASRLGRGLNVAEGLRVLLQTPAERANALSKSQSVVEDARILQSLNQGTFSKDYWNAPGIHDSAVGRIAQQILMGVEQPDYAIQEAVAAGLDIPALFGYQGHGKLVSDPDSTINFGYDLAERELPSWAQQGSYANLKQTQRNLASGLEQLQRQIVSPAEDSLEGVATFKPLVINEGGNQIEDRQLRLAVEKAFAAYGDEATEQNITDAVADMTRMDRFRAIRMIQETTMPDGSLRANEHQVATRQAEKLIANHHKATLNNEIDTKRGELLVQGVPAEEIDTQINQYHAKRVTELLNVHNKGMADKIKTRASAIMRDAKTNFTLISAADAVQQASDELGIKSSMQKVLIATPFAYDSVTGMSPEESVAWTASIRAEVQAVIGELGFKSPYAPEHIKDLLQSEHQDTQNRRLQYLQNGLASFDKEEGITSRIEAARDVTAGVKFNRTTSLLVDQMQAEAGKIINATSTPESAKTWAQSVISAAEQYKEAAKADNPSSALSSAMISTGRAVRQDEMLLRQIRAEAESGTSNNEADEVPYTGQSNPTIAGIEARLQNNRVRLNFFDELSGSEAAKQGIHRSTPSDMNLDPQMNFTNKF